MRADERREQFAQTVASGVSPRAAAESIGYKKSHAMQAATRLKKRPEVQAIVSEIQAAGREKAAFGLSEAMKACEKAVDFAYEKKNPMAAVKGTELLCKLSGLLVEKHEVVTVSIRDALDLALARALERNTATVQVEPSPPAVLPGPVAVESSAPSNGQQ